MADLGVAPTSGVGTHHQTRGDGAHVQQLQPGVPAAAVGARPGSLIFIAGSPSGYSTVVLGLIIFSIRGNG